MGISCAPSRAPPPGRAYLPNLGGIPEGTGQADRVFRCVFASARHTLIWLDLSSGGARFFSHWSLFEDA
jgi:hypothetical protein